MVASSHDIGTVFALHPAWPLAAFCLPAFRMEPNMTVQTLATRVDSLEERVTRLEELPARVDALTSQVLQLRDEVRAEFSAVRSEIRAGDEETRRVLGDEIRAVDTRIMNQVRVLHEDVVSRLALIQEGTHGRPGPGTTRRSRKR
jgi:outer membrane murein-binding lipoprotein Lpp